MIVPASIADWAQAVVIAGLLGGAGGLFARALREEDRLAPVPAKDEEVGIGLLRSSGAERELVARAS
jgi:hypothetical protein